MKLLLMFVALAAVNHGKKVGKMALKLVSSDHPLMSSKLETFDFQNPPVDVQQLCNDLIETMIDHEGLGLSANQCGLPYRVFVLWSSPTMVCFNPRIVSEDLDQIYFSEGCLSYPNLYVKIKRSNKIKVRYQKPNGETVTENLMGMTARIFQHELDHLNGVVYTSRANKLHLDRALRHKKAHDRIVKNNPRAASSGAVQLFKEVNDGSPA